MATNKEILQNFLNTVSKRIGQGQKEKGMRKSGRSAKSLKSKISEKGDLTRGTLRGSAYFQQQEEGRGPTPPNAPRSQPTLQQTLLRFWIPYIPKFAGLSRKEKTGLSYAIAHVIHKRGWDKRGARLNITKIIQEEKKELLKTAIGSNVQEFRSQILRAFRDGN